jgi:TetR/AcrR family transcriptional repressor of nem operon
MSRPKQYNRTELLDRAVELFRRQGFNGTSTAELVAELGVNRKSMYAEFGSKQELFEATLEHYDRNHLTRVLAPIEADDAGVDSIRRAFIGYASASEGWFQGRGCLMCNTAVERAALDPASGRFAAAYLDRITRAFRNALENGTRAGELAATADLDELAAFLTTMLIGVAASIRAEAPSEQLHATSRAVSTFLDLHRPAAER